MNHRAPRSPRSVALASGRDRPAWGALEALEPRQLLSTFTVLNTNDSGSGSLREAISSANGLPGADIINFDQSISGQLLALTTGELPITGDLTINGLGLTVYATAIGSSRVFYNTATTTIRDLTITGGNGTGAVGSGNGGAIYNDSGATLTLADVVITENSATNRGGGIFNSSGSSLLFLTESTIVNHNTAGSSGGGIYSGAGSAVSLSDSSVEMNFAATDGGGIYNGANGTLTLTNSGISANQAGGGTGGGVVNDGMLSMVSNSTISGNSAGTSGGGIYNPNGGNIVDMTESTISDNTAGTAGGGIFSELGGEVTLLNSTISGNVAGTSGGGIYNPRGGHVVLRSSTIADNTAAMNGGGIWNGGPDDPDPDVHLLSTFMEAFNSTISGNEAGSSGGGIYNDYLGDYPMGNIGAVTIANSTIAANNAEVSGGGLYNFPDNDTIFLSTVVAGNTADGHAEEIMGRLSTGSENNLIQDAASAGELSNGVGGNIVGVDPLLASLTFNGGPTQTHALLAGSPAIGAGSDPFDLSTDQRDGPFTRGTAVDIGAYQRQTLSLVVDTLTDEDDGDFSSGNLSLREAIGLTNLNPEPDSIGFDPALNGGTITLGGTELIVDDDVTITGPGAESLAVDGDDASRVFWIANGAAATISGLTITGGNGVGPSESGTGGGILNQGTLAITDSTVSNNSAAIGGGIQSAVGATLTIANSVLMANTATNRAGGIHNWGTLTITDSTISENSTTNFGAGILNEGGMTVTGSTITGNASSVHGGGIFNTGTATVTGSTVADNTSSSNGGGIFNASTGTMTLGTSAVSNNTAGGGGGGVFNAHTITITDATIAGNTATGNGGGLFHNGGSDGVALVTGSTISANSAAKGGGIDIFTGTLTLTNSTISSNTASDQGGGLFNASAGTLAVNNSTITANTAPSGGGGLAISGGTATLRSTIVAGNTGGDVSGTLASGSSNNLTSGDPLLGPLANNGGPTFTHALLTGSPALRVGSNPLSLGTDQRGGSFARAVGGFVDIGSFQDQTPVAAEDGEVTVFGGGQLDKLLAYQTKAKRSEGTGFGPVELVGQTKQISYRIFNSGPGMLVISAIEPRGQRPDDYSIVSGPSFNIAPGESSTFTVAFDPTAYGTRRANIAIFSNDPAHGGRFTLRIAGRGIPDPALQDIDVTGASASISDNDRKARSNTGQRFGAVEIGQSAVIIYTITNAGQGTLTFTGAVVRVAGTGPADFIIMAFPPVASLASAESTTFWVQFSPVAFGLRSATLEIFTNDPDEATFDFKIVGTGI